MTGISLGYPLDLLLNRKCKPDDFDERRQRKGIDHKLDAIQLPDALKAGSGNIIIKGRPGTGKSTLALQMAVSCTQNNNDCSAAYFSLEEQIDHILKKAELFGWNKWLKPMKELNDLDESASSKELGDFLEGVLTTVNDKNEVVTPSKPIVLLPSLSPRSISVDDSKENSLFWERYHQLEIFLEAVDRINERAKDEETKKVQKLKLIVIDSLNTFGDHMLEREELFRIFDLFKRHQIIGVFILEVNDGASPQALSNMHQNTIEYMADTIIDLQMSEDHGYFTRYLEIEKSRYQHQVYGRHPYRLHDFDPQQPKDPLKSDFQPAYNIFPSLHYLVSVIGQNSNAVVEKGDPATSPANGAQYKQNTDSIEESKQLNIVKENEKDKVVENSNSVTELFDFGINGINDLLPTNFLRTSVVAIEGPKATFKSSISENFLIRGLLSNSSVLLIKLQDKPSFNLHKIRLNEGLLHYTKIGLEEFPEEKDRLKRLGCIQDKLIKPKHGNRFSDYQKSVKINEVEWEFEENGPRIIELDFGEGMLLAEEFVQIVRDIFQLFKKDKPIKSVVLDDVSLIGISYPFLKNSKTAGDLFLPSFIHLMRSFDVSLVINGTTGDLVEANEYVNRASALADTVITCKNCDIFGDKYVIVSGEGLVVRMSKEAGMREPVPGVIRIEEVEDQGETEIPENDEEPLRSGERVKSDKNEDQALLEEYRKPENSKELSQLQNVKYKKKLDSTFPSPFVLDLLFLQGLVGFETQRIHRPGLSLHMMEASSETRIYNQEVEKLLQFALAKPTHPYNERRNNVDQVSDVSVNTFDTRLAESMYDSFNLLQDAPIERTVVCTLDEFLGSRETYTKSLVKINNAHKKKEDSSIQSISGQQHNSKRELKREDFIVQDNNSGWPYYGNVLLLAYRSDIFTDPKKTFRSWDAIFKGISDKKDEIKLIKEFPIREGFDYGVLSHESMSCVLLDVLFSGLKESKIEIDIEQENFLQNIFSKSKLQNYFTNPEFMNEVVAITNLIQSRSKKILINPTNMESNMVEIEYVGELDLLEKSREYNVPINEIMETNKTTISELFEKQPLQIPLKCSVRPDSAVYLCWYSQIRELINQYPKMARLINIEPLPGRGVTGDWFLGIIKGSVSIQLGQNVINMLCDETEDFKRYNRGIGLPMRQTFYGKNLKAWQGTDISLDRVREIHDNAIKRSKIVNYAIVRHAFANALQDLLFNPNDDQSIINILNSLADQVEVLNNK